jgi:hypothetical protein
MLIFSEEWIREVAWEKVPLIGGNWVLVRYFIKFFITEVFYSHNKKWEGFFIFYIIFFLVIFFGIFFLV